MIKIREKVILLYRIFP